MKNYELALIINPDLASRFNPYKEHLESVLNELDFKNIYCENVGIRELAYPIKEFTKGHYLIYQLEGNSSEIANLESKLKYDNSVLRHLLITVDELNSSDSFLTQDTRDSKKLAEENLAAAASATSAAISFALQNEKMNETFSPTGMGSVNVNTIQDGERLAVLAQEQKGSRNAPEKNKNKDLIDEYNKIASANDGIVYSRKGGGYTGDINEAKTKPKRLSRSSPMNFQGAINRFGGNVGPKSSMGDYINALSNMEPKSLKDISESLGLKDYQAAKPARSNRNGGIIRQAIAEKANDKAIKAQNIDCLLYTSPSPRD